MFFFYISISYIIIINDLKKKIPTHIRKITLCNVSDSVKK